jgi:hypothetical protein
MQCGLVALQPVSVPDPLSMHASHSAGSAPLHTPPAQLVPTLTVGVAAHARRAHVRRAGVVVAAVRAREARHARVRPVATGHAVRCTGAAAQIRARARRAVEAGLAHGRAVARGPAVRNAGHTARVRAHGRRVRAGDAHVGGCARAHLTTRAHARAAHRYRRVHARVRGAGVPWCTPRCRCTALPRCTARTAARRWPRCSEGCRRYSPVSPCPRRCPRTPRTGCCCWQTSAPH